MNYKVLYRKYRPTTFEEVVGQNNTIELLKNSIEDNKISHAYIFSGPRGTGKTSTAKIFAKTINCLAEEGVEKPCNKCENCMNFAQNNDVYEIDAASNNGVDQIREIIDNIKLSPINSKYKVYIIDEDHMLSTSAFNALLLTLEEPPSHVVFVLATTDIEDVPITILSRCQRLDFKKISNKDIKNTLKSISEKENIDIEEAAIEEIAEFADGGLRDALSILDQLSKNNEKITQDKVLDSIGLISSKSIIELIESIDKNNVDKIIEFVEKVRENSADFKTLVKKIIQFLKKKAVNLKLDTEKSRLSYSDCKNLCLELSAALYKSNVNIDSYSILELILLDYVAENSSSDHDLKEKNNISQEIKKKESNTSSIINVEKELDSHVVHTNNTTKLYFPGNISQTIDVRINNCFVKANKNYLNDSKVLWEKFINETDDKRIKGLLLDTSVVLSSDEILVIKADFQDVVDNINQNLNSIEEEFNKLLTTNYKLVAVSQERWEKEIEIFKENKKNNIEYKYKKEPNNDDRTNVLEDVFVKHKIEIK